MCIVVIYPELYRYEIYYCEPGMFCYPVYCNPFPGFIPRSGNFCMWLAIWCRHCSLNLHRFVINFSLGCEKLWSGVVAVIVVYNVCMLNCAKLS